MKNNYKMYISLALYAVLGLVIGYVVAKGVIYVVNRHKNADSAMNTNATSTDQMVKTFEGSVTANFEGNRTTKFAFVYDGSLTAEQGKDAKSRYVYVKNASSTVVATIYLSYEGGRGLTGPEYVTQVIKKFVPSVTSPDVMVHGSTTWTHTVSANTSWHILSDEGEWLAVIESPKVNADKIANILETFSFSREEMAK